MEVRALGNVDHARHELGPTRVVFRAVVEIDHQGGEVSKAGPHRFPPLGEAVGEAVAGDFGADPVEKDFIEGGDQDAHGGEGGIGLEVVIGGLDRDAAFTPTRKRADFDGGLGIEGDAQSIGGSIGISINLSQPGEDGVGLRNFFLRLTFGDFLGKVA